LLSPLKFRSLDFDYLNKKKHPPAGGQEGLMPAKGWSESGWLLPSWSALDCLAKQAR